MKRLLLLFALNCYGVTLPSIKNPAIWEGEEHWQVQKAREIAFRYTEPFENFHNGKFDIVWSDDFFLAAAGFGSSVLDSIYRELEFSGLLAVKPLSFLSLELGETANLSWIPQNDSWQEHKISLGLNLFYKSWLRFSLLQKTYLASKTPIDFSSLLDCEANFNSLYSFGFKLPVKEQSGADFTFYQQITLGYFNVYNSFSYPGPVLGFGFILSVYNFAAGLGHLRSAYPEGHTGYLARWRF